MLRVREVRGREPPDPVDYPADYPVDYPVDLTTSSMAEVIFCLGCGGKEGGNRRILQIICSPWLSYNLLHGGGYVLLRVRGEREREPTCGGSCEAPGRDSNSLNQNGYAAAAGKSSGQRSHQSLRIHFHAISPQSSTDSHTPIPQDTCRFHTTSKLTCDYLLFLGGGSAGFLYLPAAARAELGSQHTVK